MYVSRRTGLLPALAILGIALALGACGVKGNLESPKAAAAPEPAASESVVVESSQEKIFMSESKIVRGGTPQIMPSMPPKAWSANRDLAKTKSSGSAPRAKSSAPDKPFVLDWLL